MKNVLLLLSIGLAIIGLACNFYFYGSFGGVDNFSLGYATLGFFLDLSKFALVPVGVFYFYRGMIPEASIAGGFWLVLTVISLVAAFGFLSLKNSEYEATALAQSAAFESAKAQVESANAKVESLSKFANSNANDNALQTKSELETKLNSLWSAPAQNSLGHKIGMSVQAKLGSCPGSSWYHKTYCPQITILEQKIAQAEGKSGGYEQYLAALAFRDNALKQLTNLNVEATGAYHPVFENMALMFGTRPNSMKVAFITITAIVLELLASALIYLRSRMTYSKMGRTFDGVVVSQNASQPIQKEKPPTNGVASPTNGVPLNDAGSASNESTNGVPDSEEKPANGRQLDEKEKTLYEKLENAVKTKGLENLSYPSIKKFLGISNNSLVGKLRNQLVWRKHAVYDSTRKCIPITD